MSLSDRMKRAMADKEVLYQYLTNGRGVVTGTTGLWRVEDVMKALDEIEREQNRDR